MKQVMLLIAFIAPLLTTACSSTPKTVPVKVFSEPAGGYVIYRIDAKDRDESPWIYLGTTPLQSTLNFEKDIARKARKVSIKIMKEGYFDSNKDWQPEKIEEEFKERKMLFWNPSLIRHNNRQLLNSDQINK